MWLEYKNYHLACQGNIGQQFVIDVDQIAKIIVPLIAQFAVMPRRRYRPEADELILAGVAAAS